MSNYNLIELYNKFGLLDNNTQIIYIIILLIILFTIFNLIPLSNKLFYTIIISIAIYVIILSNKYKSVDNELKNINKINTSLNLKNYKFISLDLEICKIYFDIIKYQDIDKYSYMNSLADTDKFIEIYYDIKNKNKDYSQLLDIALEKKNSALNHLVCISNSITPNIGLNLQTNATYENPIENTLLTKINELRTLFDNYWFEILDICRTIFETNPININSRPITYESNEPNPNSKIDQFDFYYGNVMP